MSARARPASARHWSRITSYNVCYTKLLRDILFGIQQPEKHHPEIDAGVHVGMAMDLAAETGSGPRVVFALLLHDVVV